MQSSEKYGGIYTTHMKNEGKHVLIVSMKQLNRKTLRSISQASFEGTDKANWKGK